MNTETPTLPVFRTAETVLDACIKDIDDGLWICGLLTRGHDNKPAGCAIGLIGINSGSYTETNTDGTRVNVEMNYPGLGRWTEQGKEAIRILAEAVPNHHKKYLENHRHPWYQTQHNAEFSISYNDAGLKVDD